MKIPDHTPRTIVLTVLAAVVILAGIAFFRGHPANRIQTEPRLTMADLDAKAQPFIDEANSAIPYAVAKLCDHRYRLFQKLAKDKCTNGTEARDFIASVLEPHIIVPLRKAATFYACAVNADAAVDMTADAALDSLSRQLYATTGLAIEAVFIKATIDSAIHVLCCCAPQLAASWGLTGTCTVADGPMPVGDIIGVVLAIGGTAWYCRDIYCAYRALPADMIMALQNAVSATVAQCRLEAAAAL